MHWLKVSVLSNFCGENAVFIFAGTSEYGINPPIPHPPLSIPPPPPTPENLSSCFLGKSAKKFGNLKIFQNMVIEDASTILIIKIMAHLQAAERCDVSKCTIFYPSDIIVTE